jgi:hypothetical protein
MTVRARYRTIAFKKFYLILFVFTAVIVRAETGERIEIRQAVLESFRYSPVASPSNQEQPASDPTPRVESDSETIVLPKYDVRSRPLPRGLNEAVAKSRPMGPQNHTKFGTGIQEKDFGKVRLSAITVLYIPIGVGLSW